MDAPFVDPDLVRRHVDGGSYARGVAYHRDGMVLDVRWDPPAQTLRAVVRGSERTPYRCTIRLDAGGGYPILDAACSCPLGGDCKHAVAALLASNDAVARMTPRTPAPARPTWRDVLRGPARDTGAAALALGVELRRRSSASRDWWAPRTVEAVAPAGLAGPDGRADLVVGFRPLARGTSGKWIKSGVSWDVVRRPGAPFPETQARWLADLHALTRDQRSLGQLADGSEWLTLDSATSPLLWPHLAGADAAGVPIVAAQRHSKVSLARTADFRIEVGQGPDGDLLVRPQVTIDGRAADAADVVPLGGAAVAHVSADAATIDILLAPLRLDPVARGLLRGADVRVPAEDAEEFFHDDHPRLARAHAVVAAKGFTLPPLAPPHLQVRVAFTAGDRAAVTLRWIYPGAGAFGFGTDPNAPDRDASFERDAAARLTTAWPEAAGPGATIELQGVDAAEFAVHVLPELARIEGVRVETTGERPAYRELTGDPHITVSTVESDDPDWFDLGIIVTIDGTRIPFTPLFTALSKRRSKLLMVDGSYFSLAHPALDRLRELIDEAATLTEWETGPRITRYQTPLWSDFEDLADVAEPAVSWRATADALRGMTGLASVPPPPGLVARLRPYQQAGLDHLAFLWGHRLGGILADDMGLGKTLQILALLAHARAHGEDRPFLIVAPTSVTSTWLAEAERFTPDLSVTIVDRTAQARGTRLRDDAAGADVIVTSYAVLRLDAAEFQAITWGALILDEAQMVKNPRTQLYRAARDVPAGVVFAVTGTPLENRLDELWTLLSLTSPGLFPSARRFREEYVKPIEQGKVPDDAEGGPYRAARLERLRRRIRPFLLRRTKELVAPELPPKQEQVLRIDLSPAHRAAYDAVLQRERQKILGLLTDLDRNRFIVFRSLTLLRLLSLSPALVDAGDERIRSSKLDTLLDMLDEITAEGRRALVFSQFTSYLALAAADLEARGIRFVQLDGSTRDRKGVVDAFRGDDAAVFLISLRAGGFGLTLTEADHVFLLDPWWNPAVEAQAVDRAHRIGQTRPVNVYRLVANGTIEEKVMALQERKARLFDAVLDDEALFAQTLSADDIRHLFDG